MESKLQKEARQRNFAIMQMRGMQTILRRFVGENLITERDRQDITLHLEMLIHDIRKASEKAKIKRKKDGK